MIADAAELELKNALHPEIDHSDIAGTLYLKNPNVAEAREKFRLAHNQHCAARKILGEAESDLEDYGIYCD